MSDFERQHDQRAKAAEEKAYSEGERINAEALKDFANGQIKHEMGLAEELAMREMRKSFTRIMSELNMDPFTALAVAGQVLGEYAALMDHLIQTEPQRFEAFFVMSELSPRLKGNDMVRTLQLNTADGAQNFKPKSSEVRARSKKMKELRARIDKPDMSAEELIELFNEVVGIMGPKRR